jgi:hypothetical protein
MQGKHSCVACKHLVCMRIKDDWIPPSMSSIYAVRICCRVVTCMRQWKGKLVEAGFQELVFEDAMEVVIDQLNSLGTEEPLKVAMLEENMR